MSFHREPLKNLLHRRSRHGLFFRRQYFRILRVDGREEGVEQRVFGAVELDHATLVIDLVEQQAVVHLVVRPALDDLGLDLELDDRHRFLHLRHEADFLRRKTAVGGNLRNELFARVVLVGFQRDRGERQDADAVTVFQRLHVAVAQAGEVEEILGLHEG